MSDSVNTGTVSHQGSLSMAFSRKEYGMGWHVLLQGIFPTQGLNLSLLWLLKFRWILNHWATAPMWVGVIQSVGGLNKKADPLLSRREFFLPDCLQTETLAFSGPWIQTEPLAPPGSWSCWPSGRDYTIGSACSLTLQVLEFAFLYNHVTQSFTVNLYMCMYM